MNTKSSMNIKLPPLNGQDSIISNKHSIVLIGANGSGKTRMSTWIEFNNENLNVHRISAQKSLNLPNSTRPSDIKQSQEMFLYGYTDERNERVNNTGKYNNRWGHNPDIHLLNDFTALMVLLVTDEYEKLTTEHEEHNNGNKKYSVITKLEQIQQIWENIIPNKKLKIKTGTIKVYNKNAPNELYWGAEMSDGERSIFYFIGEALCVLPDSLIIIDEPENHLHKSILIRLWDAIESARPDCTFLYITHDLGFAMSRTDSQIIWAKNMPAIGNWEYELINFDNNIVDALKLEIMGNRQNVLLIEGKDSNSYDKRIYSRLFPDYNVIAVESCDKVIEYTKAYNKLNNLNYVKVKGIVDRDRRSDDEVKALNKDNIFCPEVAEIENLFLLPEIIKIIADMQLHGDEYEQIIQETKDNVFNFLTKEIEKQTLLFIKQKINNQLNQLANCKATTLDVYKENINSMPNKINIDDTYKEIKNKIQQVIDNKDYLGTLKIINNKGLITESKILTVFGITKTNFIDFIFRAMNASNEIPNILKNYIHID